MRAAALALSSCVLAVVAAAPASSFARCYSIWKYPWAQSCGVHNPVKERNWYVEVTAPPPPVRDERSPQDIADQKEHDEAVKAHHDEINFLMSVLKNEEGNQ